MKNILNYRFGFYLLIGVLLGIFTMYILEENVFDDDEISEEQVIQTITNFFSSIEITQFDKSHFLEIGILSPCDSAIKSQNSFRV